VVENEERYSPFIEDRHGAKTVAYQPLVVGLAGIWSDDCYSEGDGVIDDTGRWSTDM
jgi:hypothetical protein